MFKDIKTKNIVIYAVLFVICVFGMPSAVSAQTVTATLPSFPVKLNDTVLDPKYEEYPVIVYNDITYFPMTYRYAYYLNLTTTFSNNTLYIDRFDSTVRSLERYTHSSANKKKFTVNVAKFNIVLYKSSLKEPETIKNSKEPYPLLEYRGITYFPLTWRFAVDEFGWDYSFDQKNGLQIRSRIYGESDNYIHSGNMYFGYPASTWSDGKTGTGSDPFMFSYKIGDQPEKTFDLEKQLSKAGRGIYYNKQAAQNGSTMYYPLDPKACISGDIVELPVVYQYEDTATTRKNAKLYINYKTGTLVKEEMLS